MPKTATEAFWIASFLELEDDKRFLYFYDKTHELIQSTFTPPNSPNSNTDYSISSPETLPSVVYNQKPSSTGVETTATATQISDSPQQGSSRDSGLSNFMNFSHAQTGIFNTEGMTENQKYMFQSAMYRKGLGVPQDLVLSAQYMEKAALGGDALAQGLFGDMNEFGIGVPRNYEVAAHWYEKSVTNGSTYAYLNLAIMYFEGRGVAKNLDKAEAYFKKSLLQERSVVAVYNLGILYLNHNRYAEAEALLLEAKQKGLKNMDTALATCYDKLKKYDKSIPLWKTMAQQGQPEGMVEMAYHYKQGQGVPINHHKAYYLSGMAAKHGDRMEDGNVSLL